MTRLSSFNKKELEKLDRILCRMCRYHYYKLQIQEKFDWVAVRSGKSKYDLGYLLARRAESFQTLAQRFYISDKPFKKYCNGVLASKEIFSTGLLDRVSSLAAGRFERKINEFKPNKTRFNAPYNSAYYDYIESFGAALTANWYLILYDLETSEVKTPNLTFAANEETLELTNFVDNNNVVYRGILSNEHSTKLYLSTPTTINSLGGQMEIMLKSELDEATRADLTTGDLTIRYDNGDSTHCQVFLINKNSKTSVKNIQKAKQHLHLYRNSVFIKNCNLTDTKAYQRQFSIPLDFLEPFVSTSTNLAFFQYSENEMAICELKINADYSATFRHKHQFLSAEYKCRLTVNNAGGHKSLQVDVLFDSPQQTFMMNLFKFEPFGNRTKIILNGSYWGKFGDNSQEGKIRLYINPDDMDIEAAVINMNECEDFQLLEVWNAIKKR